MGTPKLKTIPEECVVQDFSLTGLSSSLSTTGPQPQLTPKNASTSVNNPVAENPVPLPRHLRANTN